MAKTHRILTQALGKKSEVKLHKEWLKGAGADMTLLTHVEKIDGKQFRALFNFTITPQDDYYIIKKQELMRSEICDISLYPPTTVIKNSILQNKKLKQNNKNLQFFAIGGVAFGLVVLGIYLRSKKKNEEINISKPKK